MGRKRVVITGMGTINPLGNDVVTFGENLMKGVSGAAMITRFDPTLHVTKFACEVKGFDAEDYLGKKEVRRVDAFVAYAMKATEEAIADAGIGEDILTSERTGIIFGTGIGGLTTFQEEIGRFHLEYPKMSPFFIPKMIANMAPGVLSIKHGIRGVNYTTVTACASASHAIVSAADNIRLGRADLVITGGSEATIISSGIAGFNALKALSQRNDDPQTASRPMDRDRDGFVMGEGAGALILEDYEHAVKRGAMIYAELVGCGLNGDAYHMTAPRSDGMGATRAMQLALEDAGLQPPDVDYVNMHGTSTGLGDVAEVKAILNCFGEHAYNLSVSATKSMTGHLLGAAGVVEAIASVLAIRRSEIPPTINQFNLDEKIDPRVDFTFNKSKRREVTIALSNTFGFGGHNATLLLKRMS